jgi:hypothetical protein
LVRNIPTSRPRSNAAPPTRNATRTRSLSSRPVARLTSTFSAIFVSLQSIVPTGGRASRRGSAPKIGPPRACS